MLWSLLPIHRTGQDLHQVLQGHGQGDLAAGATHQTPLQLGGRVSGGDLPRRQEDSGTGEAKVGCGLLLSNLLLLLQRMSGSDGVVLRSGDGRGWESPRKEYSHFNILRLNNSSETFNIHEIFIVNVNATTVKETEL